MKKAHKRAPSITRETLRHLAVELPREALRRANGGSGGDDITSSTTQISVPTGSAPTSHTFVPDRPF
jgi:hypothetical protein